MSLQKSFPVGPPRADFELNDFHKIIYQKGRRVLYEKALECPCKSPSTNQQSNCKNCGGSGWIYYNPKETRMVIQGINIVNDIKPWSEESRGTVNITCRDDEQLCFMDRLTILDGKSIFQEVVFVKPYELDNTKYFCWTTYPLRQLLTAGAFINVSQRLRLLQSSDIEIGPGNLLFIKKEFVDSLPHNTDSEFGVSVSLRYYHSPQYYVLEMKRETMQSFKYVEGKEVIQNMPLSAIGRRSHYLLNSPNTANNRFVDNSYEQFECGVFGNIGLSCDCECTTTIVIPPSQQNNIDMIPFPFTNQNQINLEHNQGTLLVDVTIYDQFGLEIEGEVKVIDHNNIVIKFTVQTSGLIVLTRKIV